MAYKALKRHKAALLHHSYTNYDSYECHLQLYTDLT